MVVGVDNNFNNVDRLIREDIIWQPYTQHGLGIDNINIKSAKGSYLFAEDGKRYIDLISSWWVNIHGHCNEEIAEAIYKQSLELDHVIFSGFLHKPALDLADNLLDLANDDFSKVFFSDNGSTAVEVGLKMAYQYWVNTGKPRGRFLSFSGGYHGDTLGAMSVGKGSGYFKLFNDLFCEVDIVSYPSTWINDEDIDSKEDNCLSELENLLSSRLGDYAGIIIEPLVQGASGMNMCRPIFLKKLLNLASNYNTLVIFDEVMTGFYRTGNIFAYQSLYGLGGEFLPDIICVSKGITGGFMALSATLTTNKVYDSFLGNNMDKAFLHGHSYTGNPIACAAANKSIELLLRSDTADKVRKISKWFSEYVDDLFLGGLVDNPRSVGCILAFDLKNFNNNYGSDMNFRVKKMFLTYGLNLRPLGKSVYLLPPYSLSEDDMEYTKSCINEVLFNIKN